MQDQDALFRNLESAEVEALGPMPGAEEVSPTTDRYDRTAALTAEIHYSGTVQQASAEVDPDDPFPPPRSLTEED
jgi:hypothetical protein